ncbi:GerAB/ArcD/ProY family transporter [Ornithinibacillus scapharcae]|uniref:GerAB/ArcD/ProY family transporter n=1 Tax=Ornithinibacillus scapharcae TaxID=1147159 RepID=UPI000225BD06|nr:endospore germination permease [Ornithinibacillus scapharcae]
MNKQRDKVTNLQLSFIVISTMIGVSLLSLTRFIVEYSGSGAPFATLVGIVIGLIGIVGLVLVGKRFPTKTIIGYNEIILGKSFGRMMSVFIILLFIILAGLETRQYAEAIKGSILSETPIQVAIIAMILLCMTTSYQSVATFAYIHFFYVPLILIPILLILVFAFRDAEMYHVTPFLGHEPSIKEFINGALVLPQALGNFLVIAMVIPFMKEPMKSMKGAVWGYLIAGLIIFIVVTMTVAVFGDKEIMQMFWPTLILGRMIQVPTEILSRIDAILLISWIYAVFTTLLSYYFIIVRGICELFRFHHYRLISVLAAPIVFIIAILPDDIFHMYDYILLVTKFALLPLLVYPFMLLVVAAIRRKKGHE